MKRVIKPLIFLPIFLWASIIEIQSIDEIPKIEASALVLFDVDDTLVRYPSHLGSELWFCEAIQHPDFQQYAALIANNLPVVPVEKQVVDLIRTLQAQDIAVMAITSRFLHHPALPNWTGKTIEQIESIGIGFPTAPKISPSTPHPSFYKKGVFILGKNNKGEALAAFLAKMEKIPTHIVLIDDRLSDLKDAEQAVDIPFTGYWYRAIELSRKAYDSKAAWAELGRYVESSSEVSG